MPLSVYYTELCGKSISFFAETLQFFGSMIRYDFKEEGGAEKWKNRMHKKNADTGPAIAGVSAMQKKEASGYKRNTCNPNGANQYSHSEDLPSDRAGNPRSNSSGTMRLSATIVYQSAVRASSPKHKSGAHGEACELADSRSNGFRNCSGSRRSGHDPAAGRESGSNRRRPECCPEFSRTVEMNERNKIKILLRLRQRYAIIEAYKAECRFSGPGACLEVLL